jgi:transposase-like protein
VPKGKTYTPEFKEQAARRVVEKSLPIAEVARELGINDTTLGVSIQPIVVALWLLALRDCR